MHSRLNIPAPARLRLEITHGETLTRQSNAELRGNPKRISGSLCREKFPTVPDAARTANRHRWVSVSALRRARETSLRNSAH
jgi:hypothetical protein